ncbi:ATP-grasp domain-containing protein [Staphylococcus lutrae]|uniref:ATP-grasp domain family protein n=1 Tax=Staphylococcus lutrae TaxID=155085 RepID=A0AAC9RTM8_9STAP|nr:ATP-grasp domain-containing protein [Staphylococcus lutrae]ARJ50622.1 ATP-grasp domain family protein [Staphylococcus lutrae]PNZ38809.1 ATP-grasp domain-containing protein [Staphylococcus lutrae]
MTILILSITGREKTPYDEWFEDTSERVILFCPTEQKESYSESQYLRIESFDHYKDNPNIEMRALALSQQYPITHVLSISEFDVLRAARLRELLQLEGQSFISATAYRDKILMKQLLQASSVKIPQFDKAIDAEHVRHFVESQGLPVVLKPIDGSGSSNVVIAREQSDIDTFLLAHDDLHQYEIEQYIEGEMYHVDGLIHQASVVCAYVSHYYNGCLSFQDHQPLSSYLLQKDNPLNMLLQQEVKKVIATLPSLPNGSFHAEFFVTSNGDIYFCEIGSRTGGGEIGRTLAFAAGFELNQMSLKLQLGYDDVLKKVKPLERYAGFVLLPPQNATYGGIRQSLDESWVVSQTNKATPGQKFKAAQHSVDVIISVVVEGENEAVLIERIEQVIAWYHDHVIWY